MAISTLKQRFGGHRGLVGGFFFLATVQLVWCYLWITRPYVSTALYEQGAERMPFQGRCLMMLPMRLAHSSTLLQAIAQPFGRSHFWFPRPVQPEVLMQAVIDVACLLVAGYFTTRIYQASSRYRLLTVLLYPLLLVIFAFTYVLHTVQNFRFIYDLPSLAFFSAAMYLIYFRKPVLWFAALFLVATVNRETTLLLLPLFMIDRAVVNGKLRWKSMFRRDTLAVVLPLSFFWVMWVVYIRLHFQHNLSEFYPRLNWNVKSLLAPLAWPQMLSACGYMLILVTVMRHRIHDSRLRAWLWLLPFWILFMFSYGILIETRIFGELIPLVACGAALIFENLLLARMRLHGPGTIRAVDRRELEFDRAA